MAPLHSTLRKQLETAVTKARPIAEQAALDALTVLGARRPETRTLATQSERDLRTALRAKAKILGGEGERDAGWTPLIEEIAYQQWHRMLFARFLAENNLLLHPTGVAVSLDDCAEIAREEGIDDRWEIAARYAAAMLPGLFRADNPTVQIRFAPEGQLKLEKLLSDLPVDIFTSDDGLGWVYQFWQKEKKDQINAGGKKIGAAEIGPVTQLFTEDYMVRFLLENSLGAWWAARHPQSPLLKDWDYLRFNDDETPAAGSFSGWPERAADVTVMDPCCGSGHFLVAAFDMLRKMRMEEEGLTAPEAADAVLRDNLFGLEIDPRCTQIATFAVALAAWKAGGHPDRNPPQIACSGIAAGGTAEEWSRLGGNDDSLRYALGEMHRLFKDAPTLGSLIDPLRALEAGRAYQPGFRIASWSRVEKLLRSHQPTDVEIDVFTGALVETAKAASLVGRTFTLVVTNVPFLARWRQEEELASYCLQYCPDGKGDLAMVFIERIATFMHPSGTGAFIAPQTWLSQTSYRSFREKVLTDREWNLIAWVGEGGFASSAAAGAFVAMGIVTSKSPSANHRIRALNVSSTPEPIEKAKALIFSELLDVFQSSQLSNPDARIIPATVSTGNLLQEYAESFQGICTGDYSRFGRKWWEFRV
ncbi:MAG: DNA methyltransferase, partial [Verrucomicrobiales bacterium]